MARPNLRPNGLFRDAITKVNLGFSFTQVDPLEDK
jgi:hypothetical protein